MFSEGVDVDIVFGPSYFRGNDFRMDRLGFIVAVIDNRFTPPPSSRYIRIQKKSEITALLGTSLPNNDPWDNSLYMMAGLVDYHIYNNIADVRPEDKIDVYYHNPKSANFITELENMAYIFSLIDAMTVTGIDNMYYVDNNLYNNNIKNETAIFYGYTHSNFYKKVYLATEFIIMLKRLIEKENIFCGLIGRLTGLYYNINKNTASVLINNNINFGMKHSLINPRNLNGKLFHHVYTNKWIKRKIKDIMLSYVGRENGKNLWVDVSNELEAFGAYLNSLPCGPINFKVKVDEDNNVESSNVLNGEIHYYGATTDGFIDIQRINITVKIAPY